MDKKVKNIYTVKLTYKADITLTVEADNGDDALRMATEKAQAADNSEFNIYDEENIEIIGRITDVMNTAAISRFITRFFRFFSFIRLAPSLRIGTGNPLSAGYWPTQKISHSHLRVSCRYSRVYPAG